MLDLVLSTVSQGLLWAIMALGVFLTFRVLDIADLSVEGTFPLGAAVAATLIDAGHSVWFAMLIALSALSNFSCKEKEEEYTEGGLVFGGIYMLDGQQLVETDGYILELPAEQNTVELRIVSKGVQEFGIGGYPMSGLGEYKVEGFTIKVTPDPASEKLEIYDHIDVEYKGEQHRIPRYLQTLRLGADTNTGQQKEIRIRFITNIPNYWMEWSQLTVRQAGR